MQLYNHTIQEPTLRLSERLERLELEKVMNLKLNRYLELIFRCTERDQAVQALELLRLQPEYKCPAASVLALHLMLDLYSETSSDQANVMRISSNLETAAEELLALSKLVKTLN
jgi:hypothetical protein